MKPNRYNFDLNVEEKKTVSEIPCNVFNFDAALNFTQPYEDETLESWITRIARLNGFDQTWKFIKYFIARDKDKRLEDRCLKINPYDVFKKFGIKDFVQFYVQMTYYPIQSLFLTPYRQMENLRWDYTNEFLRSRRFTKTSYICPECQKEKEYIRRSHNIPGVKVCYKHHCSLIDENGNTVGEVNDDSIAYTEYSHDLLTKHYDLSLINLEIIRGWTCDIERGIRLLMEKYPNMDLPVSRKIKVKKDNEYEVINDTFNTIAQFYHKTCGTMLCTTIEAFNYGFKCPNCSPSDDEIFKSHINKKEGYSIVDISKNKIIVHHSECGDDTIVNKTAFFDGRRCRCETFWTPSRIKKELEKDGDYELIECTANTLVVKHLKCGNILRRKNKHTYVKPFCKYCDIDHKYTVEMLKEMVESVEGLTYIRGGTGGFGDKGTMTLKCDCGHKFKKTVAEFKKHPWCGNCHKKEKKNETMNEFLRFKEMLGEDTVLYIENTHKKYKQQIYKYVRRGWIKKLAKGIYGFKDINFLKVAEARFVNHNGEIIGYTRRDSFLKDIGIDNIDSIYDKCYATTNTTTRRRQPIKIIVGNVPVSVTTVIDGFDPKHWREAQVADYMFSVAYMPWHSHVTQKEFYTKLEKYIKKYKLDTDLIDELINLNSKRPHKRIKEKINEEKKRKD